MCAEAAAAMVVRRVLIETCCARTEFKCSSLTLDQRCSTLLLSRITWYMVVSLDLYQRVLSLERRPPVLLASYANNQGSSQPSRHAGGSRATQQRCRNSSHARRDNRGNNLTERSAHAVGFWKRSSNLRVRLCCVPLCFVSTVKRGYDPVNSLCSCVKSARSL